MTLYFLAISISCIVRIAIMCHIQEVVKDSCDRIQHIPNNIRTYRKRRRIHPVIIQQVPNATETNNQMPVIYINAVRDAVVESEEDYDPLTPPTGFI